jgi:alanine-glyoxylate transaminase / serine-glyoxylate transaminase / serine-pyruvate transaminase
MTVAPLNPPERLLCGPGPANISPAVQDAMQRPLLGHMDPDLADINAEVVELLRAAYQASDGALVLPLQATGTSGMEAGLAHLLEPGDTAIIGVNGFFGRRIVEIATRVGAEVVPVEAGWGQPVANEHLMQALEAHPDARLMTVVHAETSSGAEHPLAQLGAQLRDRQVLLMADCVTSLGGVELAFDAWGVDFAYSCTQKCLGAPPGMSPVAVSGRAMDRVRSRTHPVPYSNDLQLLHDYWVKRPAVYHHTVPVLHIYALHEALRDVTTEGLSARWERHARAGGALQDGLRSRGLELLTNSDYQLPQLTAVLVPDGVDAKQVQTALLREHGIEIGGGLGPSAPSMWRIGLMGHNATVEVAERVLTALDAVL